jgi:hypothetical protein
MGVNKHLPHVFVLPEDDANRQLAVGFVMGIDMIHSRQIFVLPVAGGWKLVLQHFLSDHVSDMEKFPQRYMVLLIDFDSNEQRLGDATSDIPPALRERVFILGVWSEPEDLKRAGLGSYETIGLAMARDCRKETSATWHHDLLWHNEDQLARLRNKVRPILF